MLEQYPVYTTHSDSGLGHFVILRHSIFPFTDSYVLSEKPKHQTERSRTDEMQQKTLQFCNRPVFVRISSILSNASNLCSEAIKPIKIDVTIQTGEQEFLRHVNMAIKIVSISRPIANDVSNYVRHRAEVSKVS